jgi:tRNA uridine 5-carboxymethylaminomethyl modification enzyme
LFALGSEPLILPRSSSYTGTLVDDLVTKEIGEPYRMMTSRSEYRLLLRQDNADARLTPYGRKIGLVDDHRWALFADKQEKIGSEKHRLATTRIHPEQNWNDALEEYGEELKQSVTLAELLRRPKVPYAIIESQAPSSIESPFAFAMALETEIKYEGYIERQKSQIAQAEKHDNVKLPTDLDYNELVHLSKETRERLNRIRPETLGQASRMGGVRPADISVLMVYLEAQRRRDRELASAGSSPR